MYEEVNLFFNRGNGSEATSNQKRHNPRTAFQQELKRIYALPPVESEQARLPNSVLRGSNDASVQN